MKKTKHTWFLFIFATITAIIICFGLSSCGKSPDYPIVDAKSVKYYCEGIDDFGFNINVVTNKKDLDIKFVSFSGENVDSLKVKFADDTWDSLKELKIKGCYLKLIGFVCHTDMDHVRIDSVKLNIDGNEMEYYFDDPITHYNTNNISRENGSGGAYLLNLPTLISVTSLDPTSEYLTEYQFIYATDKDITISDFGFNHFLEFDNPTVYINDENTGSLSDSLPLKVAAGSTIKIISKINFSSDIKGSYIEYVYCDFYLTYISENNGQEYSIKNSIICQSAINPEEAENILKILIDSASEKNK